MRQDKSHLTIYSNFRIRAAGGLFEGLSARFGPGASQRILISRVLLVWRRNDGIICKNDIETGYRSITIGNFDLQQRESD